VSADRSAIIALPVMPAKAGVQSLKHGSGFPRARE
jgi:hypothetical protein